MAKKHSKKNAVTMTDVARRAGVSQSTVSRTFSGSESVDPQKRAAILAAARELNYRPNIMAQGLAMGQTLTIGILTRYLASPFFGNVLHGIEYGVKERGYFPIVVSGGELPLEGEKGIDTLISRRVDGLLVFVNNDLLSTDYLQSVASHTPLIIIGRKVRGLENHCITVKNYEAGYAAAHYLITKGHTLIAHIKGPAPDAMPRYQGYSQALEDAGLEVHPELVMDADFSEISGYMVAEDLLKKREQFPFTAVFASNDQIAIGFRLALHRHRLAVPDDISLMGFDDIPSVQYMIPPLTTMRQPMYQLGYTSTQILFSVMDGKPPQAFSFPAELVERETVKNIT